jgi:DNA-directed RNA polymerase specialized sigma24 family protein
MDATEQAQRHRQNFFPLMGRHLSSLYHFVRHQLRYLEAVGDLMPGELAPEEVVDAVVARAYEEFPAAPSGRALRRRLVQLAREQLAAEVGRLKSWRERTPVRTEDDVPETPPEQSVRALGDEILDFHEPDEDLKVEDIIEDLDVETPEEIAATHEVQACVDAALAGLPAEWRRAILLHHVDGLEGDELARALGQSREESARMLEHARAYVRERLTESACLRPAS